MPVVPAVDPAPFATVPQLEALLQRTFTAAEVSTAELLLRIATAKIRTAAANQTISLVLGDTHVERTSRGFVTLPQRPVLTVDAVTLQETPSAVATPVTTYIWDGGDTVTDTGRGLVTVIYGHGYATIPDDIQGLCLDIAARGLLTPHGVNQTSLGSFSESYDRQVAMTLRREEREMLRHYRRSQHTLTAR